MTLLPSRAHNALREYLSPAPSQPLDLVLFVAQPVFEILDCFRLLFEGLLCCLHETTDLNALLTDLKRPYSSQPGFHCGANHNDGQDDEHRSNQSEHWRYPKDQPDNADIRQVTGARRFRQVRPM